MLELLVWWLGLRDIISFDWPSISKKPNQSILPSSQTQTPISIHSHPSCALKGFCSWSSLISTSSFSTLSKHHLSHLNSISDSQNTNDIEFVQRSWTSNQIQTINFESSYHLILLLLFHHLSHPHHHHLSSTSNQTTSTISTLIQALIQLLQPLILKSFKTFSQIESWTYLPNLKAHLANLQIWFITSSSLIPTSIPQKPR